MNEPFVLLIIFGIGIILSILFTTYYLIKKGSETIFQGSGKPISMAKMLLASIHILTQHLTGVLIVMIIAILMSFKIIDSNAGLPVISTIGGYLLGKTFKDNELTTPKRNTANRQQNQD